MTRIPTLDIPAVHIKQPIWIPTSKQVWESIDPDDPTATGPMTVLVAVSSGAVEVSVERYDWINDKPQFEAQIKVHQNGCGDFQEYIAGGSNPQTLWYRLTELASAASVAAQRLQSIIDGGSWT